MRFIFAALTAFILLAMFTLFFYQLYEAPFSPTLSAANQKTPIIIYDKDKLHFVNPACDDIKQGISEVLAASQICKTDDECDTGIHLCDIVLN